MSSLNPTRDEFAAMFDASFGDANMGEGKVVAATILSLENDFAVLDVGLKTEGRVPLREFGSEAKALAVGQTVEAVSYTHLDVYKRQLYWFFYSVHFCLGQL